jgi:hypothetical protein
VGPGSQNTTWLEEGGRALQALAVGGCKAGVKLSAEQFARSNKKQALTG